MCPQLLLERVDMSLSELLGGVSAPLSPAVSSAGGALSGRLHCMEAVRPDQIAQAMHTYHINEADNSREWVPDSEGSMCDLELGQVDPGWAGAAGTAHRRTVAQAGGGTLSTLSCPALTRVMPGLWGDADGPGIRQILMNRRTIPVANHTCFSPQGVLKVPWLGTRLLRVSIAALCKTAGRAEGRAESRADCSLLQTALCCSAALLCSA